MAGLSASNAALEGKVLECRGFGGKDDDLTCRFVSGGISAVVRKANFGGFKLSGFPENENITVSVQNWGKEVGSKMLTPAEVLACSERSTLTLTSNGVPAGSITLILSRPSDFHILPLATIDARVDKSKSLSDCAFGTCYRSKDGLAVAQVVNAKLRGDVNVLKKIQHKNILPAVACSPIEGGRLNIVYNITRDDRCLDTHLIDNDAAERLTWPIRLSIALGIAQALQYLTEAGIYYRDVRCSNIVLQGNVPKLIWGGVAGLIDFGDVCFGDESHMCPEYKYETHSYNKKTEVYALGVILSEILTGTVASTDGIGLVGISDMRLDDDTNITDSLSLLSERCMDENASSRPDFEEVVRLLKAKYDTCKIPTIPEAPQQHAVHEGRAASPILESIGQKQPDSGEQEKLHQALEGKFTLIALSFLDSKADKSRSLSDCAFGACYRGKENNYAVAQVVNAKLRGDVNVLKKIQHKNILPAVACSPIEGGRLNIVYNITRDDRCLDTHLIDNDAAERLTWPIRLSIALGIAQALQYLADAGIYHRDVRCSNIVLQGNRVPKLIWGGVAGLIDFGDVCFGGESHMCPEYKRTRTYNKKTEVYALGVVFGEIISGTIASKDDVFKGSSGFSTFPDMRLNEETDIVETLTSLAEKCTTTCDQRPQLTDIVKLLAGVAVEIPTPPPLPVAPTPPISAPTPPAPPAAPAPPVSPVPPAAPPTPMANEKPMTQCILCFEVDNRKPGVVCPKKLDDPPCFTCKHCYKEQMERGSKTCPKCKSPYTSAKGDDGSGEGDFSREIEDEANNNFAKIYSGTTEIENLIEMLTECKKMPKESKEHKVYLCMIHNLFDEFKFLNRYPPKELKITAELFGGIVANKALEDDKLLSALKFVFTNLAVYQSTDNLHKFSLWALAKYMHRLPEWPQYCALLRDKVKNINTLIPGIEKYLVAKGSTEPAQPQAQQVQAPTQVQPQALPEAPVKPAPKPADKGIGSAHIFDISTLENHAQHPVPDKDVVDGLSFITNNLDKNNLNQSCAEIVNILKPQFMPYFGDYLVIKRASLEPNFQELYMQMLTKLSNKDLDNAVLDSTITAIKALLKSERILTEPSEKTLLKNLGKWLGLQTIARNKPIMGKKLDIKGMLFTSVAEDSMAAVVPFVAKVLEQSNKSTVFRPPNPWTMSILNILGEIYYLPVKLTLKFEIEVVCQLLGITVADIQDSTGANRDQIRELYSNSPSPDAYKLARYRKAPAQAQQPKEPAAPSQPVPPKAQKEDAWGSSSKDASLSWIPNAQKQGYEQRAPPSLQQENIRGLAASDPALRKAAFSALEEGLKELSTAVVGRSVFIAKTATKELVVKDFALDPDDNMMKTAAEQMVKCLAAHLAIVTCKESLKVTMKNNLKSLLPMENPAHIETIVKDNLDYGVSLIEKFAITEAAKEMEQSLASIIEKRREGWKPEANEAFLKTLPTTNRPMGSLGVIQLKVYSDFGEMSGNVLTPSQMRSLEKLNSILLEIEQETEKHYSGTSKPDSNVLSLTHTTFTTHSQSSSHDAIKKLLCNIPPLIREETAVVFAKHIFQKVFELGDRILQEQKDENEKGLHVAMLINEVCLFILQSVREKNVQEIVEELTKLLISHEKKWCVEDPLQPTYNPPTPQEKQGHTRALYQTSVDRCHSI
eukprot:TRINITY_DN227_c0_g2_i1.p1 TRINITY_DN227_c0_g2~~TRINITY_DN227_c0_g2_i1.p1  ORF type:complete len:1678 (+),score=611.01 TRINITY_DN227_c0_g2_i1:61-5034(+)